MTANQLQTMCAGLTSNAGMIRVFRQSADGNAVLVMRTFRVEDVLKLLKRKSAYYYSVRQDEPVHLPVKS